MQQPQWYEPATKVRDPGGVFDYIRPLATIEPTAIALGLPVEVRDMAGE